MFYYNKLVLYWMLYFNYTYAKFMLSENEIFKCSNNAKEHIFKQFKQISKHTIVFHVTQPTPFKCTHAHVFSKGDISKIILWILQQFLPKWPCRDWCNMKVQGHWSLIYKKRIIRRPPLSTWHLKLLLEIVSSATTEKDGPISNIFFMTPYHRQRWAWWQISDDYRS